MKVSLFIPCFVDQFFPKVGMAMADVLEGLGHEVDVPANQTCCGQPGFNSGFHDDARVVAEHTLGLFESAEAVVLCSGSCTTMVRVFYKELFPDDPEMQAKSAAMAEKTFEFSEFLVDKLGVTDVGAAFDGRVTFHDGCHGLRELHVKQQPRTLLEHVRGLELVEMKEAESCCGFGGTFAVKFPQVSTAMAEVKAASIDQTEAPTVVSNDPSCLMQIQGYADKQKQGVRCLHLAEVLAKK